MYRRGARDPARSRCRTRAPASRRAAAAPTDAAPPTRVTPAGASGCSNHRTRSTRSRPQRSHLSQRHRPCRQHPQRYTAEPELASDHLGSTQIPGVRSGLQLEQHPLAAQRLRRLTIRGVEHRAQQLRARDSAPCGDRVKPSHLLRRQPQPHPLRPTHASKRTGLRPHKTGDQGVRYSSRREPPTPSAPPRRGTPGWVVDGRVTRSDRPGKAARSGHTRPQAAI